MKFLTELTTSLARTLNDLVSSTEADHPGMPDTAAMVYVGDVYVLRELRQRRHVDGWGDRHYSCDTQECRRLP